MHVHKELNKKDTDVMHSGKNNLECNQFGNIREAGSWSDSVSSWQRNLGNRYLQAASLNTPVSQKTTLKNRTPVIQRKCACGGSCASCAAKNDEKKRIQAKLKIGPANDVYELEADRVAEQVMRMPKPAGQTESAHSLLAKQIQRLPGRDSGGFTTDINLTQSDGRPLSEATRAYMEPRFGVDFSNVRLHTEQRSQRNASDIQARAFTYGNDITLGRGESETDRNLMAHELTHVIQQRGRESFGQRQTTVPSPATPSAPATPVATPAAPTPVKVKFEEKGDKYGYDDRTDANLPRKSVEKGGDDTVTAKVDPASEIGRVSFESSDTAKVSVSPASPSSGNQEVKVSGVAKGSAEVSAKAEGSEIGKMKVNTYDKLSKDVAVTLVHKKSSGAGDAAYTSTDIADADIKSIFKKVYKQAVMEMKLSRKTAKTVEFDINKDGKIDVDSWMSDEMKKVRDACKTAEDFNIFFVDKPSDGTSGFMSFNQKYGYIHGDNGNARTVCHELGHGLDLRHTTPDTENIMYDFTSATKWRLRENQWNKLNP